MTVKPKLNRDEMLQAEFEYIADTAFQANEDRSRVTSFYFVSTGSLVAAILGTQFAEAQVKNVSLALALLFLTLTILGALTLAQLARLRAAWHESVQAMNKIKDFYIKENPEIASAFKWRVKSIPPTDKPFSIANLMAVEVSLLGALTTGAVIYFLLNFFGAVNANSWAFVALGVPAGYFAQWKWYKYLLVDNQ
ncbi:MAG: hypothetical protein PHQ36_07455 [Anaerolineales bacterium]|nr:hypothetical protein [Anaerolineales bacterium]